MAGNPYLSIVNGVKTMVRALQTSAGASSAGSLVALNSSGLVDPTMLPAGSMNHFAAPLNVGVPALSSLTQVNVSGSGSVIENPGIALTLMDTAPPADGAQYIRCLAHAAPTAPYRVAVYIVPDMVGAGWQGYGLGFMDASGKLDTAFAIPSQSQGQKMTWTNPTSRSGDTTISTFSPYPAQPNWMAVRDDGAGNVYWEISQSGAIWSAAITQSTAGGFLSDYSNIVFAIFCDSNAPVTMAASALCWDVNALSGRKVGVAQ